MNILNRNDTCVKGGESTLLDGLAIVEELRNTQPKYFDTLSRIHVSFQKLHYERYHYPVEYIIFQLLLELNQLICCIGNHT